MSSGDPNHDPLVGKTVGERYRVIARLGEGGMGAVYRATQLNVGRDVAIKVIRPDRLSDEASVAQLVREAEAIARLTSPHTVTLLDVGPLDGEGAFIAMELLEGQTLRKRQGAAPLRPPEAAAVIDAVATAVAEAHARGILHRDLKPSNVILARSPEHDDFVKVVDFGLAIDAEETAASRAGTPAYLAPELHVGGSPSPQSDVYALGVMAYELLAGQRPFGGDRDALVRAHLEDEPPPIDDEGIPEPIASLVERCLAKHPRLRPADAGTFRSAWREGWELPDAPPRPEAQRASSPPLPTETTEGSSMWASLPADERSSGRTGAIIVGVGLVVAGLVAWRASPAPEPEAAPAAASAADAPSTSVAPAAASGPEGSSPPPSASPPPESGPPPMPTPPTATPPTTTTPPTTPASPEPHRSPPDKVDRYLPPTPSAERFDERLDDYLD